LYLVLNVFRTGSFADASHWPMVCVSDSKESAVVL
jgi:hypothetical protein